MEEITWDNAEAAYTADGSLITEGMRVWNLNYSNTLTAEQMDTVLSPSPYNPGWFRTKQGIFDGSRLFFRRPW
jgi:hypothetical protein